MVENTVSANPTESALPIVLAMGSLGTGKSTMLNRLAG